MTWGAIFMTALRALTVNKTRSLLTVLGIMIGVGSVIAMVAIGEGARAEVDSSFGRMGSNVLVLTSGTGRGGGVRTGAGSLPTLTWDDLQAIRTEVSSVRSAAPQLKATAQVVTGQLNWGTVIYGVTEDYFDIRSWVADRGELLSPSDVESGTKVAVLGQTVAEKLFGSSERAIDTTVRIGHLPFKVVGVTIGKGQSPSGTDYDDVVFVPARAFVAKIQGGLQKYLAGSIFVAARSTDVLAEAETEVRRLLRARHRLGDDSEDDFQLRNLTQVALARGENADTLSALLAGIAAVSLLVGGIGIMNIMLVSVVERTREIGVRMAVGASREAILGQFLVEALALAAFGGLVGVALGWALAAALTQSFGWPMRFRLPVAGAAVLFSGAIGLLFGLFPARKASRLNPIDALRYE